MTEQFLNIIFLLFILSMIIPALKRRAMAIRRIRMINDVEKKRSSRVITMIHRQEAFSILGFPLVRYIDIEDSERILRAIRLTEEDRPIDIIMHTPGGLVLAAEQIAAALARHKAKVTAIIPHYAMSGGTLIALAAEEIIMDHDAVLGPVDPQIGDPFRGSYPAASVLAAMQVENPNRDDHTIILADIAEKAIEQGKRKMAELLVTKMPPERANDIAATLGSGRWTHDYPIDVAEATAIGLTVSTDMPREIYDLMDLYPQAPQRRPSVEYIPTPYKPGEKPGKKD